MTAISAVAPDWSSRTSTSPRRLATCPRRTLHLLDLAQTLASLPRVLILDEVTATLPRT